MSATFFQWLCEQVKGSLSQDEADLPLPPEVCKQILMTEEESKPKGDEDDQDGVSPAVLCGVSEEDLQGESVLPLDSTYLYYAALHGIEIQLLEMKRMKNKAKKVKSEKEAMKQQAKEKEKEREKGNEEKEANVKDEKAVSNEEPSLSPLPHKPYFVEISKVLYLWEKDNEFPVPFPTMVGQQLFAVVDNVAPMKQLTSCVIEAIAALKSLWEAKEEPDARKPLSILSEVLKAIGVRGVLTCLRLRQTRGSSEDFPPSQEQLLAAFNQPHSPKSGALLTVGARALSKHCHRSLDGWWGSCEGTETKKNRDAEVLVHKLFREAVWLNIHRLPRDGAFVEVRTIEGFGARWSSDGSEFRGFLEPQMEGGHEKGWVH